MVVVVLSSPDYFGVLADDVQLEHISALHTLDQSEGDLQGETERQSERQLEKQSERPAGLQRTAVLTVQLQPWRGDGALRQQGRLFPGISLCKTTLVTSPLIV